MELHFAVASQAQVGLAISTLSLYAVESSRNVAVPIGHFATLDYSEQNGRLCAHVKSKWADRDLVLFVDNCYGEFVEDQEPCHVGADLIAGSMIKNPGGTVVRSGGWAAFKYAQRETTRAVGAPFSSNVRT